MNKPLPEAFHPHIGLTQIEQADAPITQQLPADSRLQPIDAAVEAQLRAMLHAETFDSLILDALRPRALDQNILAPARFHLLREAVNQRLQEIGRRADSPEQAEECRAACAILSARRQEHELGEALRYALIKG